MRQIFTRNNFEYLVKQFKSRPDFCNFTKISINTVKATLDKKTNPKLETIIKLSEIFNISLDDLVFKDLSK